MTEKRPRKMMIHDGRMKDTSVKHYHIDDDEQKNKLIWKRKRPLSTAIAVLLLTLIGTENPPLRVNVLGWFFYALRHYFKFTEMNVSNARVFIISYK